MTVQQLALTSTIPGAYWVRFRIVDPADEPIHYLIVGQAKYGWLEAWKDGIKPAGPDQRAFVHTNMVEEVER